MSAFHKNDSTTDKREKNAKKVNMFQINNVSTKTNVNILDNPTLNNLHVNSTTHIGPNINIAESFEKRVNEVEKISRPMMPQFQKPEKPPAHSIPKPGTNTRVYQPLKVAPVVKKSTTTGGLFSSGPVNSGPIKAQFRYKTPELSKVMPPNSAMAMSDQIEPAVGFTSASKLVSNPDVFGGVPLDPEHLYTEGNVQIYFPPQNETESVTKDANFQPYDTAYEDEIDLSQIETDIMNKKKIEEKSEKKTEEKTEEKVEEKIEQKIDEEKEETVKEVVSVFQEKVKRKRSKETLILSYEPSPLPEKPKVKKARIETSSKNRFIIHLDKEDLSDIEIIIKRS
jgi:hypothetical protein